MCIDCAQKKLCEALEVECAAGLCPNEFGQICVCVAAHRDHTHIRFRAPSGDTVTVWYSLPAPLDEVRTILPQEAFQVHEHASWIDDDEEQGIDDEAAAALERARGSFSRVILSGNSCQICFENFDKQELSEAGSETTMILPCGHRFHIQCCEEWLSEHRRCPVCRFELTAEAIAAAETKSMEFATSGREGLSWAQFLRQPIPKIDHTGDINSHLF